MLDRQDHEVGIGLACDRDVPAESLAIAEVGDGPEIFVLMVDERVFGFTADGKPVAAWSIPRAASTGRLVAGPNRPEFSMVGAEAEPRLEQYTVVFKPAGPACLSCGGTGLARWRPGRARASRELL